MMDNVKSFSYNGRTVFYFLKDIDIKLKEVRGKEMASAYMIICNENQDHIDGFQIYDEKAKVLYAMPIDAENWYVEHLMEKEE